MVLSHNMLSYEKWSVLLCAKWCFISCEDALPLEIATGYSLIEPPPHLLLTLASLIKTIPSPYTRQGQNLYEYAPLLHKNPSQNSHIIKTSYYIMNQTTKGSTWWLSLNVYTMVDLLKQSFTKNIFRMRPYSHVTYRLEDAENHELQKSSRSDLSALMKKSLQQ